MVTISPYNNTESSLTQTIVSVSSSGFRNSVVIPLGATSFEYQFANQCTYKQKVETKKQRISRIAKEKMHASWKTFDQKPLNVIRVKQVCKPHNRMFSGKK